MWLGMNAMANLPGAFAGSVPYLMLWGTVAGGWQLARGAQVAAEKLAAGDRETDFYQAKILTARFYADHVLPRALAYRHEIKNGASSLLAITEAQFGADRKTLSAV
jgi:butyryl-CoA dehydrogenase